jgi:hypothetical protein
MDPLRIQGVLSEARPILTELFGKRVGLEWLGRVGEDVIAFIGIKSFSERDAARLSAAIPKALSECMVVVDVDNSKADLLGYADRIGQLLEAEGRSFFDRPRS